jgi:hypothetical protein
LAGIYTHTSAHIVAAPMAHYMAKHTSRFLFSHETCYLPVYGISNFLKNTAMHMTFKSVDGKQIGFHASMNYIYRPDGFKQFCMYDFFSKLKFIAKSKAENIGQEYFLFTDEHPLKSNSVVVYREHPCIPVFPWNWLGSTKKMETPMTNMLTHGTELDSTKEEYGYKFMILFLSFRSAADLLNDGSYQRRWIVAYNDNLFSKHMIEIAENIQTIHNSLESSIPPNSLIDRTILQDLDDFDEAGQGNQDVSMTCIGEYFATTTGETPMMEEDSNVINPKIKETPIVTALRQEAEERESVVMKSVIEIGSSDHENSENYEENHHTSRFKTSIQELNALSMRRWVVQDNEMMQSEENHSIVRNVNANGSCESIEWWGIKAQLDIEQQTAFEILAACYVLTFFSDASSNTEFEQNNNEFLKQKSNLHKLARRIENYPKPLRLFVTGPAGAGKCKY